MAAYHLKHSNKTNLLTATKMIIYINVRLNLGVRHDEEINVCHNHLIKRCHVETFMQFKSQHDGRLYVDSLRT